MRTNAVAARSLSHDAYSIQVETGAAPIAVEAEEIRDRIWVNFSKIAPLIGGTRRNADGGELWEFEGHQVLFWKDFSNFRIRENGEKKWKTESFERSMFYDGASAMVPMSSLPTLTRRTFTYHRQRRTLSAEAAAVASRGRRVNVRHERRDGNDWVSLEDVAKALNVVMFNAQANRFRLVMPDFTILELRTGDNTIFQRNATHARMADPLLLFSGSPFLTIRSLKVVFGTDLSYDKSSGTLLIPERFGRVAEASTGTSQLLYRGYSAEPFSAKVEEMAVFYQEPAAVYSADHPDIYESVRDFLTDEPIQKDVAWEDRLSGNAVVSLGGNTGGIPLSGRAAVEKVGGTGRVVNGSLKWGFPLFQVQGGREYLTFGGLVGQFNVIDGVSLSHSTDHFGDGDVNPSFGVRAAYGEHDFSLFLSTATFSQTVRIKQKFVSAGTEGAWESAGGQKLAAKLTHFSVKSESTRVESSFFDEELLKDIFGDDVVTTVDPTEVDALTETAVSDKHDTTLLNVVYDPVDSIELNGSLGVSRFDRETGGTETDSDALVRVIAGDRKRRLDASFERSGSNYRSLGDPSRYQDRKIVRVAPQLEIFKPWRILGEYRKEDNGSLKRQGVPGYTNIYSSIANLFTFRPGTARVTVSEFDSSLYGGRRSTDINLTKYLGRDALELGGGISRNHLASGSVFRRSKTLRGGYQFLRPGRRVSLGHEYTWHDYPSSQAETHETQSTLLVEIKPWRLLTQYSRTPKSFLSEENLHTGYLSMGRRVSDSRLINLFFSSASERANLANPLVWRSGIELVTTFE